MVFSNFISLIIIDGFDTVLDRVNVEINNYLSYTFLFEYTF